MHVPDGLDTSCVSRTVGVSRNNWLLCLPLTIANSKVSPAATRCQR